LKDFKEFFVKLNVKLNKFSLLILLLASSWVGCVTEVKEPEKPYVATVAQDTALKETPPTKGESIPGSIVVKCRSKYDKDPKATVCGISSVKLTNEFTRSSTEHDLQGDKAAIPVARDASYSLEVKTKGCETKRKFSGMTGGMVLTAQFDNCAVK
jgi:hypothetical protein